jgi:hypothetical protein
MTGKAFSLALLTLLAASPAVAKSTGLTVRPDETWIFSISGGQPVRAHRAKPTAQPRPGEVLVTVRTMLGTTMTITSNNPGPYTYRAELVGAANGKTVPSRACTLPANGMVSFEHWPQQASAVRLSDFRRARKSGSCP